MQFLDSLVDLAGTPSVHTLRLTVFAFVVYKAVKGKN